jgi:hypothetical protein
VSCLFYFPPAFPIPFLLPTGMWNKSPPLTCLFFCGAFFMLLLSSCNLPPLSPFFFSRIHVYTPNFPCDASGARCIENSAENTNQFFFAETITDSPGFNRRRQISCGCDCVSEVRELRQSSTTRKLSCILLLLISLSVHIC